ncbi:hypothetical protein JW926_02500 [Candidatus Sumerlaeota bacterium]|nr:hypothetical protein [Candidatus Sumerlaeota bacterium]
MMKSLCRFKYQKYLVTCLFLFNIVLHYSVKGQHAMDRMMAYHDTVICVNEKGLQSGVTTYPVNPGDWLRTPYLGKGQFILRRGEKEYFFHQSSDATLSIEYWGFVLSGTIEDIHWEMKFFSVLHKGEFLKREGVAIIILSARGLTNGDEIIFQYGGIRKGDFVTPGKRNELLSGSDFPGSEENAILVENGMGFIRSETEPIVIGVSGKTNAGEVVIGKHPDMNIVRGSWNAGTSSQGNEIVSYWSISFALDAARIGEILPEDSQGEFDKTKAYFQKISNIASIDTPVASINQAFTWGVLCLEYCYYEPIGWIESLDHWTTLYSMMFPRVADWLGQCDRSRKCLLEHAKNLPDSGRVPDLDPSGKVRDDFYWNHHFIWDIEHYVNHTGDIDTLKALYPAAKKAVDHIFNTYDPDGNLLIGWDEQIGYQEDFVCTPNDGGSASMAGVETLRIMEKLAGLLGNEEDEKQYGEKEKAARSRLENELWSRDLGRFVYYRDSHGKIHWDGQYHAFSWPAIFGFSDDMGRFTSLRHMLDTLKSPRGLVYVSNNFPEHVAMTTGCQEGAPQSPIAAQALCAGGLHREGAAMFQEFANLVMSPENRGCFPETAPERGTWFSPTASFYVEGIIEGLFGIKKIKSNRISISPAIPEEWEKASIRLPEISVSITQTKTYRQMNVSLKTPIELEVNWLLPLAPDYSVKINEKPANPVLKPGINGVKMNIECPQERDIRIDVALTPAKPDVKYTAEVIEGEALKCSIQNAKASGIEDPCGALSSLHITDDGFEGRISKGLLDNFLGFGSLGEKTFSRRTFFIDMKSGDHHALFPVDIKIEPANGSFTREPAAMVKASEYFPVNFPKPHKSADWKGFRAFDTILALGLVNIADPLNALASKGKPVQEKEGEETKNLRMVSHEGIDFHVEAGKLLVIGDKIKNPCANIDVKQKGDAIHFLLIPFLNNKDVFSEVAEIIVHCSPHHAGIAMAEVEPRIIRRILRYPGDVDNWMPASQSHGYHSYGRGWSSSQAISTDDATFTIYTIDLERESEIDYVSIRSVGRLPAIGIVAITVTKR